MWASVSVFEGFGVPRAHCEILLCWGCLCWNTDAANANFCKVVNILGAQNIQGYDNDLYFIRDKQQWHPEGEGLPDCVADIETTSLLRFNSAQKRKFVISTVGAWRCSPPDHLVPCKMPREMDQRRSISCVGYDLFHASGEGHCLQ